LLFKNVIRLTAPTPNSHLIRIEPLDPNVPLAFGNEDYVVIGIAIESRSAWSQIYDGTVVRRSPTISDVQGCDELAVPRAYFAYNPIVASIQK